MNKILKSPKSFIDYSQAIDDVYENQEDYDLTQKRRVLIAFDDIIADIECNKNLSPIVIKWVLKGRRFNISLFLYCNLISKCVKQ